MALLRWASLNYNIVTVRKAMLFIGIIVGWLALFVVALVNYTEVLWLPYLVTAGFEFKEWDGFLSGEIGMTINGRAHADAVIIATIPLISLILIRFGSYKGRLQYIAYLFLLILGLLAGVGLRILILRERLQVYRRLMGDRYLEYCYEYDDLKFEEWAVGGLASVLSLLCLKMLYEKRKLTSSTQAI